MNVVVCLLVVVAGVVAGVLLVVRSLPFLLPLQPPPAVVVVDPELHI